MMEKKNSLIDIDKNLKTNYKRILLISHSDLDRDPRLQNQRLAFQSGFQIYSLGSRPFKNCGIENININNILREYCFHYKWPVLFRKPTTIIILVYKFLIATIKKPFYTNSACYRFWRYINIRDLKMLRDKYFDVIFANDIDTLPLADYIAGSYSKIVFDTHEFFPEEQCDRKWIEENQLYRLQLYSQYNSKVHAFITVNESIASRLEKMLGDKYHVIYNSKPLHMNYKSTIGHPIKLVHHGICIENRNLEMLVEMMNLISDKFELHLYLVPSDQKLLTRLKKLAVNSSVVHFHLPIPMNDIISTISQYDVFVYSLCDNNINHKYALPNKFFEAIQARLMIAMNDLPEMSKIVREYQIGVICEDFSMDSFVNMLKNLTLEQIQKFKENTNKAAMDFSSEKEMEKLRLIISDVLKNNTN